MDWSIVPYRRTLPRPIVTAHGHYTQREGHIIRVRDHDGLCGLGDCAPLPGFSRETPEAIGARWPVIAERLTQIQLPIAEVTDLCLPDDVIRETRYYPSLRFGLETALADLAARRAGVPLARWLNRNARRMVPVNALLVDDDTEPLRRSAIEKGAAGFRTFKLKVGTASLRADLERIRAIRNAVPEAQLRIDANAAWNEPQFREICGEVATLKIEFVEQPLPAGMAAAARGVSQEFGVALALDEDIASMETGRELIAGRLCDVIVLKPMIIGGLTDCLRLAELAERSAIGVVFTSVWESDVGLAATTHLAAACPSTLRAAGLATAGSISEGLVRPALHIDHGRLRIDDAPGLGLELIKEH